MDTYREQRDRHRYLSLGFFAQKVASALIRFVEEEKADGLQSVIDEAITALEGANTLDSRSGRTAFRTYAEIRTLRDVSPVEQDAKTIKALKDLKRDLSRKPPSELQEQADELINWFVRLQSQALRNYDLMSEATPRGVRQILGAC